MLAHLLRVAGPLARRGGASLFALVLLSSHAEAKTLYVNGGTGDDSTSYAANSASQPWRTLQRATWGSTNRNARVASEAAQAGDVVLVSAGVYTGTGVNSRNEPAFYVHNSGTAGNPIVFRAVGGVELRLASGTTGSTIGGYYQSHIVWDGFTINELNAPSAGDTGPVTSWGCDGCQFLNLDINGNGAANSRLDNHAGIRIEQSRNILVRNNRIYNVYSAANANNGAGVQVYSSGAIIFEHNEIFNCGSGIFLKGGPNTNIDYFTIRYNLLYNIGVRLNNVGDTNGSAIIMHAGAPNPPDRPVRIYQNIVRDSLQAAVKIWSFDGIARNNNPLNGKIVNNTFHNIQKGIWIDFEPLSDAGHVAWNNVITNAGHQVIAYNGNPTDKARFNSEHNLGFASALFGESNFGRQQLPAWQTSTRQDAAAPSSLAVDPMYVNAGAGDFRLQAGSPARSLGVDFLDLNNNGSTSDIIPAGAYITGNEVIGRTSASAPPPQPPPTSGTPQAPSNLRIVSSQ